MLLTITTTHNPATDLGFLLHKNPNRCQTGKLHFGTINIFYPIATAEKCTVAILLDIDPIGLVRNQRGGNTALDQYVNDRPYACSSFMSVAISRFFGQTLNGTCRDRPELIDQKMPLNCKISALPCRGGEALLHRLFEPLGYRIKTDRHILDVKFPEWGDSPYYRVELENETTVMALFNHLYVLIPVLDDQKHYYVSESEIDKLLKRGEGWLADHPVKEIITKRYLKYQSSYAREALAQLTEIDPQSIDDEDKSDELIETEIETKINLNEIRLKTVLNELRSANAKTVIDLGCGEGKLLRLLLKDKQFKKIIGLDVSIRSLEIATKKLRLENLADDQRKRIELLHGSLMYRDRRIENFDAAAIVEVIEHLDPPRLRAFERVVFEFAKPKTVIITTPNREYNVMWENVGPTKFRHGDHRFEWTRQEFSEWATEISQKFGYEVRFDPIGDQHSEHGPPTQMAIFTS